MVRLRRLTSASIAWGDRSAIWPSYSCRPCVTPKPGFALKLASMNALTKPGQSLFSAADWLLPLSGAFETLQPETTSAAAMADGNRGSANGRSSRADLGQQGCYAGSNDRLLARPIGSTAAHRVPDRDAHPA